MDPFRQSMIWSLAHVLLSEHPITEAFAEEVLVRESSVKSLRKFKAY